MGLLARKMGLLIKKMGLLIRKMGLRMTVSGWPPFAAECRHVCPVSFWCAVWSLEFGAQDLCFRL